MECGFYFFHAAFHWNTIQYNGHNDQQLPFALCCFPLCTHLLVHVSTFRFLLSALAPAFSGLCCAIHTEGLPGHWRVGGRITDKGDGLLSTYHGPDAVPGAELAVNKTISSGATSLVVEGDRQ